MFKKKEVVSVDQPRRNLVTKLYRAQEEESTPECRSLIKKLFKQNKNQEKDYEGSHYWWYSEVYDLDPTSLIDFIKEPLLKEHLRLKI
jgi:ribonucleotide reductase beta subunit family protein with ferritin-like domain